jgi:predicted MPP superfamily phosphohydrolase
LKRFAFLVAGLVLALGWAGWLGAIRDPAVVRYRVELAGLQRPLRMVHLSDLHGSNWDMPQVRLNRIMDQVNALHPDLVVVTGDFHASKIWDPPMRMDDAVQPLTRLKAPLGVWSVPGNHDDPYWIRWVMRRFGLKLLAGDLVDLGPIQIVGSDDLIMGQRPVQGLRAAAARAQPGKPLVALVHEPRLWTMLPANVDLVLAGHTHGRSSRKLIPNICAAGFEIPVASRCWCPLASVLRSCLFGSARRVRSWWWSWSLSRREEIQAPTNNAPRYRN